MGQKIADETERRCQNILTRGQCRNVAKPDKDLCEICDVGTLSHGPRKSKNIYELGQHQARVSQFAEDTDLKALNGEIAILRRTIEAMILECPTTKELAVKATPIGNLVEKVGKLVTSCHSIEEKLGGLLSRAQVSALAESLLKVVTKRAEAIVDDDVRSEFLKNVSCDFVKALKK